MQRTFLGNSLLYHLSKHGWTQLKLALETGLRSSSLSELISKPKRPETSTLRVLCTCWPDPESNLRVLIEHLRDEMVRAGHDGEGELQFRPSKMPNDELDRAIALVSHEAATDRNVGALILDLATLIQRAREQNGRARPASGEPLQYPEPASSVRVAADRSRPKQKGGA